MVRQWMCAQRGWHVLTGSASGETGTDRPVWGNRCQDCGQAVALVNGSGQIVQAQEGH